MDRKIVFGRSIRDILLAVSPSFLLFAGALLALYFFVDPAPPSQLVITTGEKDGDYQYYAEQYRKILKEDGVELVIRNSRGPLDNLKRLQDEDSEYDVGFAPDGLGSAEDAPDVVSFGSIYYEPLWVFSNGKKELKRFSELEGLRIAIGPDGSGTHLLALRLLKASGITHNNARLVNLGGAAAAKALRKGEVDVSMFLLSAEDPLVEDLVRDRALQLVSIDQAEAVTRQVPSLHHLKMPHGVIDLKTDLPSRDVNLVGPTATLVAKNNVHPALVYLLLKAATHVHGDPGIFEKKGEFPVDKDSTFPIDRDARGVYKSGAPFWQRYLPFWMAALLDRFVLLAIPLIALLLPLAKLVPRIYSWRIRRRIYHRYGELKFLETQIKTDATADDFRQHLADLDAIEERVNKMKVPLEFSEHLYSLKSHIEMVRARLGRTVSRPI